MKRVERDKNTPIKERFYGLDVVLGLFLLFCKALNEC